ncbi:MAG: NAD(P)/FAD-dependent oxidoreductase [Eubacteriales bacterium]|nr:NAD(P)/FAD-dependent oxidoreductase [Eubacteriales bacterium]
MKAIIIGGGVSGLSAGIFLAKEGIESEIFEKSNEVGGNLTGWDRDGYHIDNCIHWLTGTRKGTSLYKMWEELGVLGDDVDVYQADFLFSSEGENGEKITFWRDRDKARAEMLSMSPNDKKEINSFFDAVDAYADTQDSGGIIGKIRMLDSLLRYGRRSLHDLSLRFENQLIRSALCDYIGGDFSSLGLIMAYAAFSSENGGIPLKGSLKTAKRIEERYLSLGGIIHKNSTVNKIITDVDRAIGITLSDGEFYKGDVIITACDTKEVFFDFLSPDNMPKNLKEQYDNPDAFPVFSAYHCAISADSDSLPFKGTVAFPVDEYRCDNRVFRRLTIREFSHEPSFSPKGKSIIQAMLFQHEPACRKWIELKNSNPDMYYEKKMSLAYDVMTRIERHYPELQGKLDVIDSWTPSTYREYLGSPTGSFMSFAVTGKSIPKSIRNTVPGYKNIILAGQWLQAPGGLPIAARSGKRAAKSAVSVLSKFAQMAAYV